LAVQSLETYSTGIMVGVGVREIGILKKKKKYISKLAGNCCRILQLILCQKSDWI